MTDTPQPGWYPDPTGRHENRWWDGIDWTDQVADGQAVSIDSVRSGPPQQAVDPEATQPVSGVTPVAGPEATPTTPQPVPVAGQPAGHPGAPPGAPGGIPYAGEYVGPAGDKQKNRNALIVVAVLVVVAVVVGLVLASGGGDDSGDDSASSTRDQSDEPDVSDLSDEPSAADIFDDEGDTSDPLGAGDAPDDTAPADTTPSGDQAYPQESIDGFLTACTAEAPQALCQCTIDVLQRDVTYERFVEMDQQLAANPDVIPPELTAAVNECQGG
jgi:Protein of unknown function (DUF2510)